MEKFISAFQDVTGMSWLFVILVVWLLAIFGYVGSKNETLWTFLITVLISAPLVLTAALIVLKVFW